MERRDQLEEFVKNQLSSYEELPSDGLWKRIEGVIPMRAKGAKPPWVWWFCGALVVLSGLLFWHFHSVEQWKGKVQQQEVAIQQLWEEIEALQLETVARNQWEGTSSPSNIVAEKSIQAERSSEGLLEGSKTPLFNHAVRKDIPTKELQKNVETNALPPIKKPTSSLPTRQKTETTTISPVTLPASLLPVQATLAVQAQENARGDFEALKITSTKQPRWSVGAWFEGANFHDNPIRALWKRARRSENASGDTPTFYANNPSSTKTVGLFLDFDLNRRWSIRTGLGYKDQRRPLGGDFEFTYSLDNSQMNALGHSVRPYRYYDESHNISISTIIANALSNGSGELEPGEVFEMDFAAYQQTRYVSIPLWLTYRMGQGRLKYHLRTGVTWNDLIGNSSKIRYLSLSFSQLYYQGHAISDGAIQVGYLDVGFGYGLEYGLMPHLGLYMDGVMYKSITPIFDRQPFSLGLGGGIRYQF